MFFFVFVSRVILYGISIVTCRFSLSIGRRCTRFTLNFHFRAVLVGAELEVVSTSLLAVQLHGRLCGWLLALQIDVRDTEISQKVTVIVAPFVSDRSVGIPSNFQVKLLNYRLQIRQSRRSCVSRYAKRQLMYMVSDMNPGTFIVFA